MSYEYNLMLNKLIYSVRHGGGIHGLNERVRVQSVNEGRTFFFVSAGQALRGSVKALGVRALVEALAQLPARIAAPM
jgi:hypothetical protein